MTVKTLTDYLDPKALQLLQDAFSEVARMPIRICGPGGEPLTARSSGGQAPDVGPAEGDGRSAPALLDGHRLGRVVLESDAPGATETSPDGPAPVLRLMAYMIGWLCDRQRQIRTRVDELATLYQITAEFTSKRDPQSLLDFVAQTVVDVLGVKACAIRLLSEDGTELLIQARAGLSPEYLDKGRILLAHSEIDREVLAGDDCVAIEDMGADPRVQYPAEARREGIVSALCAPMTYKGRTEGVLRVYTAQPHRFDWFEVSLLRSVASQAAAAITHARLDVEAERAAELQRQLKTAAVVQRRMIPAASPDVRGLDVAGVYVPSLELAGDFYDFIELDSGRWGIVICDVAGKGVRASLLMASIRAVLRSYAAVKPDIAEVIASVNRQLCTDTPVSDFATMFYAVYDPPTRRLTYVNAGHVPPLLVRSGEFCHLMTGGVVLGIDPDRQWDCDSLVMAPGDVIVAYTDGLSEAINFADEPFGRERVEASIRAGIEADYDAQALAMHCLWDMRRFAGLHTRFDDTTIVAMRVL